MNIYVASSWRNVYQPEVIKSIKEYGKLNNLNLEVYDYRNPSAEHGGFSWAEIDENWKNWTVEQFEEALRHPRAKQGFDFDQEALAICDVCILVLPSGASAHLEAGWVCGGGGAVIIYAPELKEAGAELMYKLFDYDEHTPIYSDMSSVLEVLGNLSTDEDEII